MRGKRNINDCSCKDSGGRKVDGWGLYKKKQMNFHGMNEVFVQL